MLTRRGTLAGAAALAFWPARAQTAPVYVLPPQSLAVVRPDGNHVLSASMQRDRIIGTRTRFMTAPGATSNFTRVVDSSKLAWAEFDAATYAALIAANPTIFSDCTLASSLVGQNTDHTPIDLENWGTHPQICIMIGDSLMDSGVGASTYPQLNQAAYQCWAQPVASKSAPWTSTGDYTAFWNKKAYTNDPMQPLARICFKFAWGGWRLADQMGQTYPGTAGAHATQVHDYTAVPVGAGQGLDVIIQAGTNDEHEYVGGLLFGSPIQGSPNLVTNCLVPLVNLIRAQLPIRNIGVMTLIARGSDGSAAAFRNQAAADYAGWLMTPGNAASIGVNAVWDARTDPALDPRAWQTNTLDTTVYQADRTHLTPNGYVNHLGPAATALLDGFWVA